MELDDFTRTPNFPRMKKALTPFIFLVLFLTSAFGFDYNTNQAVFQVTNAVSGDFDAFTWEWSGYDDQKVKVGFDRSVDNMALRLAYGNNRRVYVDIIDQTNYTVGSTNWSEFTLPRTNMPPDGIYLAEFLNYDGATVTASLARTYAKGRIIVSQSIFAYTNQASWLNPYAGILLGPPTHVIVNPELWPFVSTVTGVYAVAGETFSVLDSNEAAAVQLSATGGLAQIQFRATDGTVATFGLVNGNLAFGVGSSNMISSTNYLTEVNSETDPLSVHLDGSDVMTGDLNMGGQDVTNVASILFTSSLEMPLYATNTRAQLLVVSNLIQTLHATQTYAIGISSSALTAVDGSILSTLTVIRSSIDAVSNGFGSTTGFVSKADLNAVSNTIFNWTAPVKANGNYLTNLGVLYATTIQGNNEGFGSIAPASRTLLTTNGTAVMNWSLGELVQFNRDIDLNDSNIVDVGFFETDFSDIFAITNNAYFYGGDAYIPLLHAQSTTNPAIDVENRQLWAVSNRVVLDWSDGSNLVVESKGLELGGQVRTNWYTLPSYSLYGLYSARGSTSAQVAVSAPLQSWSAMNVTFTTPVTGKINAVYNMSAEVYSSPNNVGAMFTILELKGTGVSQVATYTNFVHAFARNPSGSPVGYGHASTMICSTNLQTNTVYSYEVYVNRALYESAGTIWGDRGNASAEVYFK